MLVRSALIPVFMVAAGLLSLALSQSLATAKGPVDKITIEGAGRSIEVTQGEELLEFNPWGQLFLGERLESAPAVAEAATVTMYLKDEAGELKPVYRFTYYEGGYIYLPGPGDADRALNAGTILTQNDGRWLRASPRWQAFVAGLTGIRPPATGDGGLK